MLWAVLKLIGLFFLIGVCILWIYCLVEWDGQCHGKCNDCPYNDGHW